MSKTTQGYINCSHDYDIHEHLSGETSTPIANLIPLNALELTYGHNTTTETFNAIYRPHLAN